MYIRFNETNGRGEGGQSVRLGRRVLRLDRLESRRPRRRRDGRRPIHAPSRVGDVRAAPLKELLRLRSLVARGRARERKARTRRTTPREVVLLFAPTFPNELFLEGGDVLESSLRGTS